MLVHCSQGVSRSATIVIGYLMWKSNASYDEVFAHVKSARGVANPNIGFTCQLLQWQKRRKQPPGRARMYRMAPHHQHAPLLLVRDRLSVCAGGGPCTQAARMQKRQKHLMRGSVVTEAPDACGHELGSGSTRLVRGCAGAQNRADPEALPQQHVAGP